MREAEECEEDTVRKESGASVGLDVSFDRWDVSKGPTHECAGTSTPQGRQCARPFSVFPPQGTRHKRDLLS